MKMWNNRILPVLVATIWISFSEFARNEFLLRSYWSDHYGAMGLVFPSEPVNGAVWGIWSLLFAIFTLIITRRFSFWETVGLAWLAGFILMWVVTGNMGVLPFNLLIWAIPLSILETVLAVWIILKLAPVANKT